MSRRISLLVSLLFFCLTLSGCTGGQEIESCLFVIAMAVDAAPDGSLTITVKALSGTQESVSGSGQTGSAGGSSDGSEDRKNASGSDSAMEESEPGYIVLSATAPSCLRALGLLSATTPRTVNLSQLREIVLSQTLAETDAALSILREIHSIYRANGEAVVVVTPQNAGDFIRRQHAILGLRLSKYLEVLFEHFRAIDIIPPSPNLSAVIAAMESKTIDAAAVYAAGNDFDSMLVLQGTSDTDRLPGHLPRTAPANNEYMGSALFSGPRMTGVLTGSETGLLCLMAGKSGTRISVIDGAQYKTRLATRARRKIESDGTLSVSLTLTLTLTAGEQQRTSGEIAADIERSCASVLQKLQAASCDAVGFGRIAVRAYPDIPAWESADWDTRYPQAPVRVATDLRILQ